MEQLPVSGDASVIMAEIGMTCSADHATALQAPWRGNISLMFFTGTMEHYTPTELETWIRMVKEVQIPVLRCTLLLPNK